MKLDEIVKNFNPYRHKTEAEKFEAKKQEAQVKRDVIRFSQIAKDLFADQRYHELTEVFKKSIQTTMKMLVYYEEVDPQKYNAKMREYQTQLKTMFRIFDTPQGFINEADKILRNYNG